MLAWQHMKGKIMSKEICLELFRDKVINKFKGGSYGKKNYC